jgi:hypothetical protein
MLLQCRHPDPIFHFDAGSDRKIRKKSFHIIAACIVFLFLIIVIGMCHNFQYGILDITLKFSGKKIFV